MDRKLVKLLALIGAMGAPTTSLAQQVVDGVVSERTTTETVVSESTTEAISVIMEPETSAIS